MTFRFLPVVEAFFIDHTSTTENRLQKLLSNVEKDLFQTLKKHFSMLEKIFLKRWKTLLPNVGKHSCQTLENIFAKRWKTLLPNVGQYLCQRFGNV